MVVLWNVDGILYIQQDYSRSSRFTPTSAIAFLQIFSPTSIVPRKETYVITTNGHLSFFHTYDHVARNTIICCLCPSLSLCVSKLKHFKGFCLLQWLWVGVPESIVKLCFKKPMRHCRGEIINNEYFAYGMAWGRQRVDIIQD